MNKSVSVIDYNSVKTHGTVVFRLAFLLTPPPINRNQLKKTFNFVFHFGRVYFRDTVTLGVIKTHMTEHTPSSIWPVRYVSYIWHDSSTVENCIVTWFPAESATTSGLVFVRYKSRSCTNTNSVLREKRAVFTEYPSRQSSPHI